MPKVSVNIPCYNSSMFIRTTIESVLAQTYGDLEVIVMDDGSTDDTGDIVRSFSDSRIKYFHKENEGLSETRNRAIAASRGEYIAFLDHDDLWLPEKIEKQLEMFDKDKGLGLVFADCYVIENGKRQKATYFDRSSPCKGMVFEELLFGEANFIPLCTAMAPRDVFEKVGFFNRSFKLGEEFELFLRIAERFPVDYLNEPLALYRLHESNFSRNKDVFAKESLDILDLWKNKKPGIFVKNEARYLKKEAIISAELAHFYAAKGMFKEAIENFDLSLSKCRNRNTAVRRSVLKIAGPSGYMVFCDIIKKIKDAV